MATQIPPIVKVSELFQGLGATMDGADVDVAALVCDSRKVKDGSLFAALVGAKRAVAVNSGMSALHCCVYAAGAGAGERRDQGEGEAEVKRGTHGGRWYTGAGERRGHRAGLTEARRLPG